MNDVLSTIGQRRWLTRVLRNPGEALVSALLVNGWNETGIAGVEILAEDGVPVRVSVRGAYPNAQIEAELARFGARVVSHNLWAPRRARTNLCVRSNRSRHAEVQS